MSDEKVLKCRENERIGDIYIDLNLLRVVKGKIEACVLSFYILSLLELNPDYDSKDIVLVYSDIEKQLYLDRTKADKAVKTLNRIGYNIKVIEG